MGSEVTIRTFEPRGSKPWSSVNQRFWERQKQSYLAVDLSGEPILRVEWNYTDSGACRAIVQLVWHGLDKYTIGFGKATGYGYCKQSSAVWDAFRDAGIDLDGLNGTGLIRQAVEVVAKQIADFARIY